MRHGTSGRRQRGRGNGSRRGNQGNGRSQVFDSNGPDVRIRGTANQVAEKYVALARDSMASGDIILAESYLQHAEHYQRMVNAHTESAQPVRKGDSTNRSSRANMEKNQSSSSNNKSEDLSLPASILGGEVKPDSQEVTTEQV